MTCCRLLSSLKLFPCFQLQFTSTCCSERDGPRLLGAVCNRRLVSIRRRGSARLWRSHRGGREPSGGSPTTVGHARKHPTLLCLQGKHSLLCVSRALPAIPSPLHSHSLYISFPFCFRFFVLCPFLDQRRTGAGSRHGGRWGDISAHERRLDCRQPRRRCCRRRRRHRR